MLFVYEKGGRPRGGSKNRGCVELGVGDVLRLLNRREGGVLWVSGFGVTVGGVTVSGITVTGLVVTVAGVTVTGVV